MCVLSGPFLVNIRTLVQRLHLTVQLAKDRCARTRVLRHLVDLPLLRAERLTCRQRAPRGVEGGDTTWFGGPPASLDNPDARRVAIVRGNVRKGVGR